jgi:dephospho-CoA kinase
MERSTAGVWGDRLPRSGGAADLEAIVHPAVLAEIQQRVLACPDAPAIVIEAIKLIESGFARACDSLWVVTCPEPEQVRRLMEDRGLTEEEARMRIRAQPPQEEKVRQADVVIDNSGDLEATRRQVEAAWRRWVQERSSAPEEAS